jgi:hypothetical protein
MVRGSGSIPAIPNRCPNVGTEDLQDDDLDEIVHRLEASPSRV